ncbi:FabD/lysophospholipase-like protein [Tuber magnatum]|uniref:[acyl-carrier-protein] S-malonyltransferase n=1 Tax=Tuber magnatum TaxID=42249 RepID=A0A317SW43_9PEZI|nr:FabD/lysophospholipase-like protein [Tuber magnatum]
MKPIRPPLLLKSRVAPPAPSRVISTTTSNVRPKTAIFFPGQGSQKPGMLTPLTKAFPRTVIPLLDQLDIVLPGLRPVLFHGPSAYLTETPNAQPAILISSLAILRVLEKDFGVDPTKFDYFFGHSLGEFTALVAAEIISLKDALRLVRQRGMSMAAATAKSESEVGMFALIVEKGQVKNLEQQIREFIDSEALGDDEFLSVANVNSSTQLVISGHVSAIMNCVGQIRKFKGNDPRAVKLNVSAPFHSGIVAPAVSVVRRMLREIDMNEDNVRKVISNVSGRPYRNLIEMRENLSRQCVETVRWKDSIEWLEKQCGVDRWVGIGPGRVQTNLVGQEVKGGRSSVVAVEGMDVQGMEDAAKALDDL